MRLVYELWSIGPSASARPRSGSLTQALICQALIQELIQELIYEELIMAPRLGRSLA